ncbi:Spc98 family-domain-containing protein [Epithele typhae]|uniref:Spc98 family-domain-containing protein n=1 Tax=Epithele typhae TaxID=378194 RepID=UPI00200896DB|nr:Spc98 family-domain-containing protein [Epithele typhae]KAH9942301.1 Spc98 family-domain-containing protein [Epithele typhae]
MIHSEEAILVPGLQALPELPPRFFIPRLDDKPQNPIMDTLRLLEEDTLLHRPWCASPLSADTLRLVEVRRQESADSLWRQAVSREHGHMNQVLSWDALRSSYDRHAAPSPFLSEQNTSAFASARYHLRPPVQRPDVRLVYVHVPELFQSLILTVCGTSSSLHIWDHVSENFNVRNLQNRPRGEIVIVGKDEIVSSSLLKRFLTIGNLMRRLELLTEQARQDNLKFALLLPHSTPVIHAFVHTLSTILASLRRSAECIPADVRAIPGADARLTALWTQYEEMERILEALARLCRREENIQPSDYADLPQSPAPLLSLIYSHLSDHIESASPRIVIATLAYTLTVTSRGYFQHLCTSRAGVPGFHRPNLVEVLTRARKSLALLHAADSQHALLTDHQVRADINWLWTEEQLENMEDDLAISPFIPALEKTPCKTLHMRPQQMIFKIFDLRPVRTALSEFLNDFPHTLPRPHRPSPIDRPRTSPAGHSCAGALRRSRARFLSPSTPLHLHTHLVLLRGYILITSHSFKARLQDALFSDAEDVSAPAEARERSRRQSGKSTSRSRAASEAGKAEAKKARRAIALSPALTIGDKWPPLGSDLNFLLRTVVVDALEEGRVVGGSEERDHVDAATQAHAEIVEEAEWRLGFAIRDLPIGTGKEKWLNPLCEALDFLYMHYQPPYPLDVLITPAVLSKYHRMFAFNLRLMRLENVARTLFRLTRAQATPLFPTLAPANKLLLHFRFVAQAFTMALASYVYDVAIGSNIDGLLARLNAAAAATDRPHAGVAGSLSASGLGDAAPERAEAKASFADVFALAEHHSRVLDDVLSACLLRSGQKVVGDILRGCMELVLELGVLAGGLRDGAVEEYEAAPALEDLWGRFRGRMATFVKVLTALVEKEADSAGLVLGDIPLHLMQGRQRVSGTTANLHQLSLRLNMTEWWTKKVDRDSTAYKTMPRTKQNMGWRYTTVIDEDTTNTT